MKPSMFLPAKDFPMEQSNQNPYEPPRSNSIRESELAKPLRVRMIAILVGAVCALLVFGNAVYKIQTGITFIPTTEPQTPVFINGASSLSNWILLVLGTPFAGAIGFVATFTCLKLIAALRRG